MELRSWLPCWRRFPLHKALGLTDDEFERIRTILGRDPNYAELAMYSVMWSEHCSYKSSRRHLATLPTKGPRVLVGPGEGAGMIEVAGIAVALRIESHNHPSFVEPVQGAATGIGGVVRDVLSMGARPVALLDSLRFGPLSSDADEAASSLNRFLVEGVVSGISSYGNCIGVPTVGGEIGFSSSYSGNPLVNVMCLGVAPKDRIMLARAEGPGNAVLLLGSPTGRDGIGGVSVLASASFDDGSQDKRPSVQVGDPFTEKLLIEACLSLIEKGLVVGIQDLGGAGLCCATSESAANAGTGMRIDLDKVPCREPGMQPFEVLTSESQERMLLIVRPDDAEAALAECARMGLSASRIGEVTDNSRLEVLQGDRIVADVPAASLGDGPSYDRPSVKPNWLEALVAAELPDEKVDPAEALLQLLGSASNASKYWAWEQYDHQVMLGTVVKPGADAAVVRLPGSDARIAVTTDANGRYCYLDPYLGTMHAVAEACRNVSAVGAEPAGVTNCLNFGNPELPEVMWQFIESVRGLGEACEALGVPVTGGNVSFYNQTGDLAIYPTPVIGLVGVVPDGIQSPSMGFSSEGDIVVLLGTTHGELGGTDWLEIVQGKVLGRPPALDLKKEAAVQALVRGAIAARLLSSAHDCSSGGLAVALAECCVAGKIGARIVPKTDLDLDEWLFSESASRYVVSLLTERVGDLEMLASGAGVPFTQIGRVGGLSLAFGDQVGVDLGKLIDAHQNGFAQRMHS